MKRISNVVSLGKDWWKQERPAGEAIEVRTHRKLSDRWFSVRELADRFGLSVDVIYDEIRSKRLDAVPFRGVWRISEDAVVTYLNRPTKSAR